MTGEGDLVGQMITAVRSNDLAPGHSLAALMFGNWIGLVDGERESVQAGCRSSGNLWFPGVISGWLCQQLRSWVPSPRRGGGDMRSADPAVDAE